MRRTPLLLAGSSMQFQVSPGAAIPFENLGLNVSSIYARHVMPPHALELQVSPQRPESLLSGNTLISKLFLPNTSQA